MKIKTLSAVFTSVLLAVSGAATAEETSESPVAGSVAISNMYLWRGQDLGNGDLVVSGDVSYSNSGFHTGVWASSGDSANGQEYDLWVGYGGEAGDFTYDISAWTYTYPSAPEPTTVDGPGNLSEIILTVGYGNFSASYYDNVAGDAGYRYFTVSGQFDKFGVTIGNADAGESVTESNYTHLDVTYSFNDNLSFTLSDVIDYEDNVSGDDTKVQISYSFDI